MTDEPEQTGTATPGLGSRGRARSSLSAYECWSELRRHREGRLGYLSGRGPRHVVLPYAVRDHKLVVRVPAFNEAAQYAGGRRVSFDVVEQVGELTAERIEVVGVARLVDAGEDVPDALPDEHWPADLPTRLVCVDVDDVRGETEQLTGS